MHSFGMNTKKIKVTFLILIVFLHCPKMISILLNFVSTYKAYKYVESVIFFLRRSLIPILSREYSKLHTNDKL